MKTELFVNGIGCVSRLKDFEDLLPETHQPNYKEFIPAMKLRRMSRIMRMSNYAALSALKQAEVAIPQAINVATSYGCLVDTEKFLSTLLENNEEFANPSAFINSTHNTLAGSLAILLGAKGQNFTFVHPENAFENALIDAKIAMDEGSFQNALVGGVDEKTAILESLASHFIDEPIGEGAAFLSISNKREPQSKALINGVLIDNTKKDSNRFIREFCDELGVDVADIDLLMGNEKVFDDIPFIDYENLLGIYPTITALAGVWAINIIESQYIPDWLNMSLPKINSILIYNKYQNGSQSVILISSLV